METPRLPHLLDPLGNAILLSLSLTVLGRAAGCQVIIADRAASRRHAEIAGEGGAYILRDLDSTNGTWLNGQRLGEPAHLRDGDLIEIGSARFIFRDPDATFATTRLPRLVYDEATGDLWVDRRPVQLSPKQHALFALLWARRDQVCGKDEIAAGCSSRRSSTRSLRFSGRAATRCAAKTRSRPRSGQSAVGRSTTTRSKAW